jgi:hypothetical protein
LHRHWQLQYVVRGAPKPGQFRHHAFFQPHFFGIVNRFSRSFFSKRIDITRLIVDIGYVYVDEFQAYFFQFRFHIRGNRSKEQIAVAIDGFNIHGGNNQAQLPENNVFSKVAYGFLRQTQKPFGRIVHNVGFG